MIAVCLFTLCIYHGSIYDLSPQGCGEHMFRLWVVSSCKIAAALPGLVGLLSVVLSTNIETGIDKDDPVLHGAIVTFYKSVVAFAIGHWPLYLMSVGALGLLWALIVAEPKERAKRDFASRRNRSKRR